MDIVLIAGARPNFMKIAPIIKAIEKSNANGNKLLDYKLVHTGQHYDHNMSESFFEQLGIPKPDINLGCGGGTQAEQTANIMVKFEAYLMKEPTDLVIVVGDVTSTMACSIVAQKLHTKVAHVEGGIRSGDWNMPEEINRIVTDSISNYFFTTTNKANQQLLSNGVKPDQIFYVGNTMIDTLMSNLSNLQKPSFFNELGLEKGKYFVMTLHRPSNVDEENYLGELLELIESSVGDYPVVFPVHPRTHKILSESSFEPHSIHYVGPQSYLEFNYLVKNSCGVITDSGGITEETTVMGIPCITLRDSTERPETCEIGTNELIGKDHQLLVESIHKIIRGKWKKGQIPHLWDGKTSERIVDALLKIKV
jgi:UDP-N-acetylglucosamine 2-epimerase (non-hydrolysing)